ncbi:urease accessory protein UreD [Schizosaccharomyces japonicus yFS275]|uniref:Urease accessory protein UreD n=1 Tax=Schizosaccharomyces japonicus (strain yFS275 / FY16936) TaxID=402676 RepID=B6K820_SCHJY|nr:urease accessory protein UreD [Schizosaccharomyces japonicus yFS275]EEB09674.1 urease accessory protein UreD [Schizosaccharomyces japonicus yFS275]
MTRTLETEKPQASVGLFELEKAGNVETVRRIKFTYPLKLIVPKSTSTFTTLYVLNYGGGLVAGDEVQLRISIGDLCVLSIQTQGSTKVFKTIAGKGPSTQNIKIRIGSQATCLSLPDPVQPFADSVYTQTQVCELADDTCSLALLDWMVNGRSLLNERWDMTSYVSKNIIQRDGKTLVRDVLKLVKQDPLSACPIADRMEHFECVGTLFLVGPQFRQLSEQLLEHQRWKLDRLNKTMKAEERPVVLWTACCIRGVTIVKFGSLDTQSSRDFLLDLFKNYASHISLEALRAFR